MTERLEQVNNIWIINPQSIEKLKGKSVGEKYIIFECEDKQCWALLKWKGTINNGRNCLGCDIKSESEFGTNGTFVNKSIFKCDDGCGVLIPSDRIENCCVAEGHAKLSVINNRIDEKTICCIKQTNESKSNTLININEKIRKTNGKETGILKWVGLVNKKEVIGLDSKNLDKEGTDGTFCGVRLFNCNDKCGALFHSEFFECELKRLVDIGVNIIHPLHVKLIEKGKDIRKIMCLNMKMEKQIINIKWRGMINRHLCVGCELANSSEYGTDGTFDGQSLFNCGDKKGILIPVDQLAQGCESERHEQIQLFDVFRAEILLNIKSIRPNNICCVEWLTNINKWPQLQIDSRIKYKNQDIYGTCKWIGLVNGKEAVGVEMDNECKGTNGRFSSFDLFICMNGRGVLFTADDIEHDNNSEKLHFVFDKIVDSNKIIFVKSFENRSENRIFVGNPAMIKIDNKNYIGEVKWMGMINNEDCVGLDMEDQFEYGMDGIIRNDIRFDCMKGHGLITPLTNVKLCEDVLINPQYLVDGLINPNKYLKCEENWNNEFLNVKKDDFVFVKLRNESTETKMKGTLKWRGLMNNSPVGIVELTRDHEHGTSGIFWRSQPLECPDKRAIAVSLDNIYPYSPYERKEIPKEDRKFPEIDINSAVKFHYELNSDGEKSFGTVKWTGVDEDGKYFYGLELDERIPDGTDGEFSGQRLFKCPPGHGKLESIENIVPDNQFMEGEHNFFNQFILDLYKCANDLDLEIRIIKHLVQMKNKRLLKRFIGYEDHPLKLDAHSYLIPILIQEDNIASIKLIIDNCDLTPVSNQTFLNLAYFAMKKDDDDLFDSVMKHCQDKNGFLENGETFLTHIIKENCSIIQINKIISRSIFDLSVTNKNLEFPFIVACQKVILSIVKKLIPTSMTSKEKEEAINIVLKANDHAASLGQSTDDILNICTLLNNIETRQIMECNICRINEKNIFLECGHCICTACCEHVVECPFCRTIITTRKKIYLS